jgi:DNA methylase
MNRDIFGQLPLPLPLRIEIEENTQRKGLTQSELATQQRRILEELRKHTAPGTRTDLTDSATSAKSFAQVKRATEIVGRLFSESPRQVEKRLAVVEAAEAEPERFGPLVSQMDHTGKINQAYAELRRIQIEESEAIPNNGAEANARVIVGDFREQGHAVPDASVDLIFTDPPYAREYVPLFGDLAQFAARVLIEGGSLITYTGHQTLPEVLSLMTPHLRFHWSCAAILSQHRIVREIGVQVGFHQLLWFTKNKRRSKIWVLDCVKSVRGNKITGHEWAQGVDDALYYVKKLSRRNSLIVDPFLGSGTTAIAALQADRRFIGFEIDPETARKAKARIHRTQGSVDV